MAELGRVARWSVCLLVCLLRPAGAGEGRRLERIPGSPARDGRETAAIESPPPVGREECEADVARIARAYRGADLEALLHPEFPNRSDLLDALRRSETRATRVELRVESIESVSVGSWRTIGSGHARRLVCDCVADVRFRLNLDRVDGGQRFVSEVGRSQWVVRYEAGGPEAGDGR